MKLVQCKHKFKSKVDMNIIDYARLNKVNLENGVAPIIIGEYNVYRCLHCKCLVWDDKPVTPVK